MTLTVYLENLEQGVASPVSDLTWQQWFQGWWAALEDRDFLLCEPPERAELTLKLTTIAEMHELNQQWRGLDQPTDVLSFAALENDFPVVETESLYLGDIVIGLAIAQQQANQEGHSIELELAWLASHGLLHLLGWDHQDEGSLQQIIDRQLTLLDQIGMPYGL